MAKQIVLHYAGSYVERPHTITFDSEREYLDFIKNKGYQLKPNVEYGVFTLNAILSTQFQQSTIKVEDVSEADKPDIPTITPPTIDIKYPQCSCNDEKEKEGNNNNININITIPGLEGITGNQGNVNVDLGDNQENNQGNTNPPKEDEENKDNPPVEEENKDTPPVVTPPVEMVISSPKVSADRLSEDGAKNNINNVTVEFNSDVITITGDINALQAYPSSNPAQGTHKWVPLEIATGLSSIVGVKFNGAELTEQDRQEALSLGMAEGSFVLWIKATEDYDRDITLEKDGVIKTIKIKFNNTAQVAPGDSDVVTPEDGEDTDDTQTPSVDGNENNGGTQTDPTLPPEENAPEENGGDSEGNDNTDQGSDSDIIIPDENGPSTEGDDDIIVL